MAAPATARQVETPITATDPAPAPPATARRRLGLLRPRNLIILLVALALLVFAGIEVHQRLTHVYEYDARVMADLVTISSRVAGVLTTVEIEEGDRLAQGDVLARVDSRASELRVAALKAQLEGVSAEREQLVAQRRLLADQIGARSQSRSSAVNASAAEKSSLQAQLAMVRANLERAEALYQRRVISNRQVDQARTDLQMLQSQLRKAEAEIQEAQGSLREARVESTGLDVIDSKIVGLNAQRDRLAAELAQQQVDLTDRTIVSPINGIVDRTFVEAGEYVGAGQRIAIIHDPDDLYVEANIKETQVGRLEIGHPVEISVDAFSDTGFTGRVKSIGSSTTSNFALLPTPNPSGNFTKITQRVPVRIRLDPTDKPLSPGMMVEVNIDVRDR